MQCGIVQFRALALRARFFAEVALPLTSRLRATKPALSDEQIQDTVDETAPDSYQTVLPAHRAFIRVDAGSSGRCSMDSAFRRACVRCGTGMIDHAQFLEKHPIDVRQG
jgi:hypothetical protein